MPSPIKLRTDYSPAQLRTLAKSAKTNCQSRRLLSLAAVLDGMSRTDAARICGSCPGYAPPGREFSRFSFLSVEGGFEEVRGVLAGP